MKNKVKYLVNNNFINIEKLLLKNYLRLRIDEIDLILLLHLFDLKQNGDNFLSITELSRRTTVGPQDVADRVDILVTKGFISLDFFINNKEEKEEIFSLIPTVNKVLDLLNEDEVKEQKNNDKEILSRVIMMLEDEFKRPLSSKELQIISTWKYPFETIKESLLKALKQKKLGIEYIDKILENNSKQVERDLSYFNDFLKDE